MHDQAKDLTTSRRTVLLTGLSAATVACMSSIGASQNFPTQPPEQDGEILSNASFPEVTRGWRTDEELIKNFTNELPDTPWRREWVQSYENHEKLQTLIREGRFEYSRQHRKELEEVGRKEERRILKEVEDSIESSHPELKISEDALESRGTRLVDGGPILKELGFSWWSMDCRTYCFSILRRDSFDYQPLPLDYSISGEIGELIQAGYFPVKEPQDFDVIVYGEIEGEGANRHFSPGHFGIYRDGKIISKDILSFHIYEHAVEDSAAYASHFMYLRHKTYPDPRVLPLPKRYGSVYFEDRDGIPTPVVDSYYLPKLFAIFAGGSYLALKGITLTAKRLFGFKAKTKSELPDADA